MKSSLTLSQLMNAIKAAGAEDAADSISVDQATQMHIAAELKENVLTVVDAIVKSAVDGTPMTEEERIKLLSDIDYSTVILIGSLGVSRPQVQKATTNKITSANKARAEALKPKVKPEDQLDIEDDITGKKAKAAGPAGAAESGKASAAK